MRELFIRLLAFLRAWQERRDERLWLEWEELKRETKRHNGKLFKIVGIRQHASTGTKAFAIELGSNTVEPIWAAGAHLQKGTYVLSTNYYRNGTTARTHHNEDFLHVGGIVRSVDEKLLRGWTRWNLRKDSSSTFHDQPLA